MIRVEELHVTFKKNTPLETKALRGVDLAVADGQFVSVIGSNGAGKSTFLNVVAGDVRPESGRILIGARDVTDWPTHRRARSISRVFQDPLAGTCEQLTIMENFALAYSRSAGLGLGFAVGPELREIARERLGRLKLGLEDRLADPVGVLSGGQRQALALLMATAASTELLLLDEHTAALDPATAEFVMKLTNDVVEQQKLTTIMVTHSMRQALDFGHRTVMFHRGRIMLDVAGAERAKLSVEDLLQLFRKSQGEELADDALLLG